MEEFDENLEEKWGFTINKDENLGGSFGDVYFGTMYKKDNIENKIPVVLKSAISRDYNQVEYFKEIDEVFENEKQIFKVLSQTKEDNIVKCYGVACIDGEEYIVMEDLKIQGFETIGDVYDQLIKEKSSDDKNIIKQYEIELDKLYLYNTSSIYSSYNKQKEKINKYKQHYNEKFKQKEEKKPKQNENISYKDKVHCFFEKTEHFKKLKNILKLTTIFHNDMHERNVMVNLEKGVIKLIDLGYSIEKDYKYLEDEECDIRRYKYLKSAFYYLLSTDINEEKQQSL